MINTVKKINRLRDESEMRAPKVFLCGFSGCGKGHALRILEKMEGPNNKKIFNANFLDLDDQVFKKLEGIGPAKGLGDSIRSIGIEAFRKVEEQTLLKLLNKEVHRPMVVALGGGSLSPKMMKNFSFSEGKILIWLDTPFDICFDRIKDDGNRPLVQMGQKYLKELYFERLPLYKKAHFHLKLEDPMKIENIKNILLGFRKMGVSI